MLRTNRKPRDRSEQMIVNSYRTIKLLRERVNEPLTLPLLLEVQENMTRNTLDDSTAAGRFRTADEQIAVVDSRDERSHVVSRDYCIDGHQFSHRSVIAKYIPTASVPDFHLVFQGRRCARFTINRRRESRRGTGKLVCERLSRDWIQRWRSIRQVGE